MKKLSNLLPRALIKGDDILGAKRVIEKLCNSKPIRYQCLLCGRDKFTRKSPHNCNDGFRKRKIIWREIYE
jgi:hypothetical protein